MSFAPGRILEVRHLFQAVTDLSNVQLGVVGSATHANKGTSYHLGKDLLKASAYSIVESLRDKRGLSDAASALDIGYFTIKTSRGTFRNRDMTKWIVAECKADAPDTRDIREIIYSPDGRVVKRYDALGMRSSGDDSHLSHDHFSWFRDSEKRDKTSIFRRWLTLIGAIEGDDEMTPAEWTKLESMLKAAATTAAREVWAQKREIGSSQAPNLAELGNVLANMPREHGAQGQALASALAALAELEGKVNTLLAEVAAIGAPAPVTYDQVLAAMRQILREGVEE